LNFIVLTEIDDTEVKNETEQVIYYKLCAKLFYFLQIKRKYSKQIGNDSHYELSNFIIQFTNY